MGNFEKCFYNYNKILMEFALAERLRHEFNINIDDEVGLALIIYNE